MKKILTALLSTILMLLSASAAADTTSIELAQLRFNQSVVELDSQEAACDTQRQILPADLFDLFKITTEQRRTALKYFHDRALASCSEGALKDFLVAAASLSAVAPETATDIQEATHLIIQTQISLLKSESEFNRLDPQLREQLLQLPNLKAPFKLLESGRFLVEPT